jgi:16S rRNA (cytosine967-C5)-methyltransferase
MTSSDISSPGPPLSSLLHSTASTVQEVLDGRSLTDVLADINGALRPAVQALNFHAMRYLGWADAIGRSLVHCYPNTLFASLLLVSLTLLKVEIREDGTGALLGMPVYAAHRVVNQAVTAAAGNRALWVLIRVC